MQEHFQEFVCHSMGISSSQVCSFDSATFTAARRLRKFFRNFAGFHAPAPEPPPWALDWGPLLLPSGQPRPLDPMLTVRRVDANGVPLLLSNLAYRPCNLLYHYPTFGGPDNC